MHGYIFILSQPSDILQTLKHAHVIVINEISMMITIMLHVIKQCLKQIHSKSKPFVNMLLLLI
jgi:hypothetical protein